MSAQKINTLLPEKLQLLRNSCWLTAKVVTEGKNGSVSGLFPINKTKPTNGTPPRPSLELVCLTALLYEGEQPAALGVNWMTSVNLLEYSERSALKELENARNNLVGRLDRSIIESIKNNPSIDPNHLEAFLKRDPMGGLSDDKQRLLVEVVLYKREAAMTDEERAAVAMKKKEEELAKKEAEAAARKAALRSQVEALQEQIVESRRLTEKGEDVEVEKKKKEQKRRQRGKLTCSDGGQEGHSDERNSSCDHYDAYVDRIGREREEKEKAAKESRDKRANLSEDKPALTPPKTSLSDDKPSTSTSANKPRCHSVRTLHHYR
ncbi:hypothetical protein HK097_006036 [Rhizophlyctis rosea]|uniref:Uncharacterized protein n=1 Tax=Rhizophlyctis rosea TaxID=64517 RepID=A0AAD5X6L4_9FUNG|nr:hypothetical protein HK097_006036 [Rhizophlyctis rosea]